ncbi:signal recognition particle 14kD protein-domain-containing protein [Geopyxis carbonaria]|nr:signal recognition particle 14kD protein-domain-containing protein [Geopyxis carbonaria]
MPQERLSNQEFFTRLTTLLAAATNAHKNTIFLSQKPVPNATASDSADEPCAILIRATDGAKDYAKKVKIATVVAPQDLEVFYARYAEVSKANMGTLKKRDRKKRNKLKAKKGKEEGAAA